MNHPLKTKDLDFLDLLAGVLDCVPSQIKNIECEGGAVKKVTIHEKSYRQGRGYIVREYIYQLNNEGIILESSKDL